MTSELSYVSRNDFTDLREGKLRLKSSLEHFQKFNFRGFYNNFDQLRTKLTKGIFRAYLKGFKTPLAIRARPIVNKV